MVCGAYNYVAFEMLQVKKYPLSSLYSFNQSSQLLVMTLPVLVLCWHPFSKNVQHVQVFRNFSDTNFQSTKIYLTYFPCWQISPVKTHGISI